MFKGLMGLVSSWGDLFDQLRAKGGEGAIIRDFGWLEQLTGVLSTVLWVLLALVGAAGGIYALYIGIKMARADSAEAREENKKRLINIIISIVVVIALIIFFNTFLPMILDAAKVFENNFHGSNSNGGNVSSIQALTTAAKTFLRLY